LFEYGFLHFATASGMNIHLHVSSVAAADAVFPSDDRECPDVGALLRDEAARTRIAPAACAVYRQQVEEALRTLEVSIAQLHRK
jgi:hypothetical protein